MKSIMEQIEELATENMIEDGIHHDDFPDYVGEYSLKIIEGLKELID